MKKVAIFLVFIGVVVFLKIRNQSDDSAQVLSDMKELISSLEVYDANAEFLDRSVERRHMKAFDDAYEMGRRRRRTTFDEDKYIQDMLTMMVKDCNQANKRDLAATLVAVREELLAKE